MVRRGEIDASVLEAIDAEIAAGDLGLVDSMLVIDSRRMAVVSEHPARTASTRNHGGASAPESPSERALEAVG